MEDITKKNALETIKNQSNSAGVHLKRFNQSLKKTVLDINTLEDYNLCINSIISELSYYLEDNVMLSHVSILNQFIYSLYSH